MQFLKPALYSVLILIFFSCSRKNKTHDILNPKIFAPIFWDISNAEVYASEFLRMDSLKNDSIELNEMKKIILAHYKVSASSYEKSLNYYLNHPDLMVELIDSIKSKPLQPGKIQNKREIFKSERLLKRIHE